jgi:hypothetical protein
MVFMGAMVPRPSASVKGARRRSVGRLQKARGARDAGTGVQATPIRPHGIIKKKAFPIRRSCV